MKSNLKRIWTITAGLSIVLTLFMWFGGASPNLVNVVLALDIVMFALSLPCGVFAVPVVLSAWRYLGIDPVSIEGAYLSTVFLCVLGAVQWFWLTRVWSPVEPPLQNLNLTER